MRRSEMMKAGVLAVAVAVVLTACEQPSEVDTAPVAGLDPAAAVAPVGTSPVDAAATLGESAAAALQYGGQEAGATVMMSSVGVSKPYLVDSSGSALYTLEGANGPSACSGGCLAAWPPLLVEAAPPTVAARLQAGLLGTAERDSGATQVSYGGHLLYRYARDIPGGPPIGHDVTDEWGEWYLVGPLGELLPEGVVEDAEDAATPEDDHGY